MARASRRRGVRPKLFVVVLRRPRRPGVLRRLLGLGLGGLVARGLRLDVAGRALLVGGLAVAQRRQPEFEARRHVLGRLVGIERGEAFVAAGSGFRRRIDGVGFRLLGLDGAASSRPTPARRRRAARRGRARKAARRGSPRGRTRRRGRWRRRLRRSPLGSSSSSRCERASSSSSACRSAIGILVIVGMDFGEGEEAVAVAAVFDEGRLQRRLYARDLREIDIASERFLVRGFEIEFFDPVTSQNHHPGFFRVRTRR